MPSDFISRGVIVVCQTERTMVVSMQTIDEIRRDRLELLIQKHGSIAALNELLGYERTDSRLSQIRTQAKRSSGGKPRAMGDDTARYIEDKLQLPRGWMDTNAEMERRAADQRTVEILEMLNRLPAWQVDQVASIVRAFAAEPPPGNTPPPKT